MEMVLKVYNGGAIVTQIQDIFDATIDYDINNFNTCNLTIPVIEWLSKYDKIELYEVTTVDTLLFEWYIYDLQVWINEILLIWRSTKELMNKKLVLSDKSYTSETMTTIMEDILWDWNSAYSENWIFSTNNTTLISKDFKNWDNIYDVLEELSWLVWMVWTIEGENIIVTDLIGEDKTTWLNYTALIYNWKDPYETNISNLKSKSYSTVSNIIIGIDSTTKTTKTDATSIATFWALWESKTFRDWDLDDSIQQYLDSKKEEQRIFEFDIEVNNLGVNAWDKLKLIIENANDYLNFEWDVYVNTKRIELKNRSKIETIWVSDIYVYIDTIQNKLRQLDKNIKLLNINL